MGKRGPWHGMHMKVKRQFDIFGSLLPLCGSQEAQVMVWWHVPLPTDPSLWSLAISMLSILELFRALNFIFFWHRSHLWTRLPSNSQSSHLSLLVLGLQRCATKHSFVFSRLVTSAATTLMRNVLLHQSDYTSERAHRNKTFVLKDRKVGRALCKWPVLLIQTFMQKKKRGGEELRGEWARSILQSGLFCLSHRSVERLHRRCIFGAMERGCKGHAEWLPQKGQQGAQPSRLVRFTVSHFVERQSLNVNSYCLQLQEIPRQF